MMIGRKTRIMRLKVGCKHFMLLNVNHHYKTDLFVSYGIMVLVDLNRKKTDDDNCEVYLNFCILLFPFLKKFQITSNYSHWCQSTEENLSICWNIQKNVVRYRYYVIMTILFHPNFYFNTLYRKYFNRADVTFNI